MAEESNLYPGTSRCRPAELESGGSGVYCCIPLCKNATYNRYKERSGIGFFRFPKDKELNRKWINIVKRFRRSGGADSFTVNSSTVICEFHFKISDIKVLSGYGKKTLVTGAIPSLFKFKEFSICWHSSLVLSLVSIVSLAMKIVYQAWPRFHI